MSKLESNLRQRYIVNCLRNKPSSFKEILEYLKIRSEMDDRKYICSLRTFQRDLNEIASAYNIEIKPDKYSNYEIVYDENDDFSERLMESYDMFNALNLSKSLSNVQVRKRLSGKTLCISFNTSSA
jgi:hypothetical protein